MHQEHGEIWPVSQLTRHLKGMLEHEFGYVWVCGEVSNFRISPAGHAYFTLKDSEGEIKSVLFRGRMSRLKFEPENGLEVVAHGLVTVYERRGDLQIVCDDMQPKGMGALQLAFEKLHKKLEAEGLFDDAHKKEIPLLPRRIGVVTSPTGAAIRDILNVINRRFANVHILIYPARVQGDEAAPEIVEGIRALDEYGVDVMIIGRGGGSKEDLWPFNEEKVVRAVYNAETPIISAVGHEIDVSLSDLAADVRAPTPSAAAELVVQEQDALVGRVEQFKNRLINSMGRSVRESRNRLEFLKGHYVFQRPEELVRQRRQAVDELRMRMQDELRSRIQRGAMRLAKLDNALGLLSPARQVGRLRERIVAVRGRLKRSGGAIPERMRSRLRPLMAQLDALSPLAILSRGYSVAWKLPDKELVRDARQLARDDELEIRFGKGSATAKVEHVEDNANG